MAVRENAISEVSSAYWVALTPIEFAPPFKQGRNQNGFFFERG